MQRIIIAIDGYSSTGKSTLARDLAASLGLTYVDSGAMYRAVTLYFLRQAVKLEDEKEIEAALASIELRFDQSNQVLLNGEAVEKEIRKMEVSAAVSKVAALPAVRHEMVAQQRLLAQKAGVVMDGRDIGTAVFPHAPLKVFLTASPEVRADRRYRELMEKGQTVERESVQENLRERDRIDTTRDLNPLRMASDAVLIDNTNLSRREQLAMVKALALERVEQLPEP